MAVVRQLTWIPGASAARALRGGTPLLAASGAIYVLVLLVAICTLLIPPRLSLTLETGAHGQTSIAWVLPGGALWDQGVRAGADVRALDGAAPTRRDGGAWVGRRIRVQVPHQGVKTLDARTLYSDVSTRPLLVLSPWVFLLGTLVVLRAARTDVGRAAYALLGSAGYALAFAALSDRDDLLATVVDWAAVAVFAISVVRFAATFPHRRSAPPLYALAALPLIGILIGIVALFAPTLYDIGLVVRMVTLLVYLCAGLGVMVWSFVTTSDPEARRGLTIIGVGTVASLLPFIALHVGPVALGQPPVLPAEQAILALALLPVSFAYAILRHRVLALHLVQRWFVYGLLWGVLLVPLAGVIALRHRILGGLPEPARSVGLIALLVPCAWVAFGLPCARLQRALDRAIFKDTYDYRTSLQGVSRDLSFVADIETLGAALPKTLRELMNLDFAVFLIHDERGTSACGAAGSYEAEVVAAAADAARGMAGEPDIGPLAVGDLGALLVPLRTHGTVVGHLCLGPKTSGEPFRAEDHDLLATLSGHLAAIVRNMHLVEVLRAKVGTLAALNERLQRAQEEERARLAADLHDEPLQTALALQREMAPCDIPLVARERGQALITQLRMLCLVMRPPALDDLGLQYALDGLAREFSRHTGVSVVLDMDPEVAERGLSPAIELVLYRATQESLTNVRRHAAAHTVHITLRPHPYGVQLVVSDDGVGFALPPRLDDLATDGHLGLVGLQERVQHANGQFRVTSAPQRGTAVRIELPAEGPTV